MMTVSSPTLFAPSPRGLSSPVLLSSAASPPPSSPPPPDIMAVISRIRGDREESGRRRSSKDPIMLKRKRPMKIEIPAHIGLEDFKKTPPDMSADFESEGEGYSVCCKKGRRSGPMEDRYAVTLGIEGDSKQAFFGVFDGHGGPKAAEFAAKNLGKNVILEMSQRSDCTHEEAVKKGYVATDAEFMKQDIYGGTCCVTAVMDKGDLIVSNAGDCRAVMSRGGVAEALTVDHKPSSDDERNRIMRMGGLVLDCGRGVWRVDGSLAISRAIGDIHLKKWVIADPETRVVKIGSECEFLILASDGLWDTVTNQEAVDIVRSFCSNSVETTSREACMKLVELSVGRGSVDDISVMVVHLSHFIQ